MTTESQKKAIKKYLSDKKQLRIWITPAEYEFLVLLASREGLSLSEYVRKVLGLKDLCLKSCF